MSSMPETSKPTTIDVADGHVVHLCCGKLDDQPHRNFCPNFRRQAEVPKVGHVSPDVVRGIAARLADAGYDIDPTAAVALLYTRIDELLAEGSAPRIPESEWFPLPTCPGWCTGVHRGDDGQFRDCESEETFVPQLGDHVAGVVVGATFDRATGRFGPEAVRLEDYEFSPRYARHLGRLLIRAADLLDG
jgi:hypothetical protein